VTYRIRASETDPQIRRYDGPHYLVVNRTASSGDLLLFLTGTGGNPESVSQFLNIAAENGYRAVSLAYNDVPAVVGVCPQDPDPSCSAKFREKRIFGDDVTSHIDDLPVESIVNRLAKLLVKLTHDYPNEEWEQYLESGTPRWERIAVAGHSQGAGMAAYIAQRKRVARVILLSSPWDFYGVNRQLAPWVLRGPGATPADFWFGAYHRKENTASLIDRAYMALKIPNAHIRVFAMEPARWIGDNPYHLSVVVNAATPRASNGTPSYSEDWRFLLGKSNP
jgi:pimeloyl-ACP methyl ester carboxylesterase